MTEVHAWQKYFMRYDLEGKWQVGQDECSQIATNLCVRLRVPVSSEKIDSINKTLSKESHLVHVDEFGTWFKHEFKHQLSSIEVRRRMASL